MTFLRIVIPLYFLFEHYLFGKPVPTFPDHALKEVFSAFLPSPMRHAAAGDVSLAIAMTIALAPASYRMQNFTTACERQGA
jgi:hypothetical protein